MESHRPCIYRVPEQLRKGKPEAYRPQMLIIGPLHHSAKPKTFKEDDNSDRYLEYGMMEEHKVMYKAAFTERPDALGILDQMTSFIIEEEENIRASYAVSTEWIVKDEFVNLILDDSIFIAEFIIRLYESRGRIGDVIVDDNFHITTILDDLTLLENQLPYFYLEKLLNPIMGKFFEYQTLDKVIHQLFSISGAINVDTTFSHFTDMFYCMYKESLGPTLQLNNNSNSSIADMKSAYEYLSRAGVKFMVEGNNSRYSLKVSYNEGCLRIPRFPADESSIIILRNVIAYEQCHHLENALITNYIHFMNYLITSDEDVKILTIAGVLANGVGRSSMVLNTVHNLTIGMFVPANTQYFDVVHNLNIHYRSRTRKRMWVRAVSLSAVSFFLLTLVGTVASVIQAIRS